MSKKNNVVKITEKDLCKIVEESVNNIFNEIEDDSFDKKTKGVELPWQYKNNGEDTIPDIEDEIVDPDDEHAQNYILGRLFDAREIIMDLTDYLENSPYALERGGDKFKNYLSKATNIFNELETFLNDD